MTNTIKISGLAKRIVEQRGYEYWKPDSYFNCIELHAWDFGEDGYRLAGPFKLEGQDGEYALIYVNYFPKCLPLEKALADMRMRMHHPVTTTYMPYSSRSLIDSEYPDGVEFLYDRENKKPYSEIDLPFLSPILQAGLERKGNRCSVFAGSPEGEKLLISKMIASDVPVWLDNLSKACERISEEIIKASAYKERPYTVVVQGTDDSSWTVNAATRDEVELVLEGIRHERMRYVDKHMCFTN